MNTEENKSQRSNYIDKILQSRANGRTMICIEEANFILCCRGKDGRSKIGYSATLIIPKYKGSNLHCIGAMSSTRILTLERRHGPDKLKDCEV